MKWAKLFYTAVMLTLHCITATPARSEVIPHVSVFTDSFSLDSNSHSLTIRVSFTASITSQNKEVYVDLMNDALTEISVTDIDVEHQRLQIYISANTGYSPRTILISGKGSGSGTVTITQSGVAPALAPEAPAPSEEKLPISGNWKLVRTYTSEGGDRYEDITFYNGLGYPEQIINIGASSTNRRNVVTPIVYDPLMRDDAKVYLPYESASNSTSMRETDPLSSQMSFYSSLYGAENAAYAYKENVYEASPLNRKTAQWECGWAHRDADRKL